MVLTPEEARELQQLEQRAATAQPVRPTQPGLTPEESIELEALENKNAAFEQKQAQSISPLEAIEVAGRGALKGLTAGLSEPVISKVVIPATRAAAEFSVARDQGSDFLTAIQRAASVATDPAEIEDAVRMDIERRKELEARAPGTALVGEIGGALLPISAPAKIAGAAAKAVGLGSAATTTGKVLRGAGQAAITGSGEQAVRETGDILQQAQTGEGIIDAGQAVERIKQAGTFGAGIGGAIPVVGKIATFAAKAPKKLLSVFGGVPEDQINRYMLNADRINSAPTKEMVVEEVDSLINRIVKDKETAQLTRDQAKESLKQALVDIKDNVKVKDADLKAQLRIAEKRLSNALEDQKEKLKKVASLGDVADRVDDSLDTLKQKVQAGSARSREALGEFQNTINMDTTLKNVDSEIRKLKTAGKVAVGESRKSAIAKLEQLRGDLSELGTEVEPNALKDVLQSLDEDITFAINKGDFSKGFDGAASRVRGAINKELRNSVPGYAEIMDEVAKDARVLSEASKVFGNKQRQLSALKGLTQETKTEQVKALKNLGLATDFDFEKAITKASAAEKTLKSKKGLEGIIKKLPESREVGELSREIARRKRPEFQKLTVTKATTRDAQKLAKAQESFNDTLESFEKVKSLQKTGSRERVKSFIRSNGDKNRRFIEDISNLAEKDFKTILKDIGTTEAFTKDATRGSKNVNLWALLGLGALGGATGGFATGAVVGAIADRFGPQITKQILKGAVTIGRNPTIKSINSLKLPKSAKKYLRDQFIIQTTTKREEK